MTGSPGLKTAKPLAILRMRSSLRACEPVTLHCASLLHPSADPMCLLCKQEPHTIDHCLWRCPRRDATRQSIFGNPSTRLKVLTLELAFGDAALTTKNDNNDKSLEVEWSVINFFYRPAPSLREVGQRMKNQLISFLAPYLFTLSIIKTRISLPIKAVFRYLRRIIECLESQEGQISQILLCYSFLTP